MQRGAAGESTIGNVIAIIGDGSLSSAIAFEGLNNAAEQGGNLIIIVNDNEMSIAEDFGGMYGQLAKLRTSNGMAELNLFKAFGLDYRYVEQGNDVDALVEVLNEVKDIDHPIVVHIHTTKGLGFNDETEADNGSDGCNQTNPQPHAGQCEANHWQDPEASLGKPLDARKYYGEMAMASLERRFDNEPGLVVISPATPGSNGITRDFRERAGAHYVDTGITEEHAAAFAAGIARAGGRPVLATSATFFQRTFDQLQQELALNHVPATLLIFGAGISGADNTHSGTFDMTMFANVPDVTCWLPRAANRCLTCWLGLPARPNMAWWRFVCPASRFSHLNVPPIWRSTRCSVPKSMIQPSILPEHAPFARYQIVQPGRMWRFLDSATLCRWLRKSCRHLRKMMGRMLRSLRRWLTHCKYSTMDAELLAMLADGHRLVVTLEDGQLEGGWGEKVTAFYANSSNTKASHVRVLEFRRSQRVHRPSASWRALTNVTD